MAVDGPVRPAVQHDRVTPPAADHAPGAGPADATAPSLAALMSRLGHRFRRPELLTDALTHASAVAAAGPAGGAPRSNERLEFLGARVLGLVIADLLYNRFGGESEGALSRRLAALVRRETLARVAAALELGAALRMSPAEAEHGGRDNPALLADACEAVIAALYLDGGLRAAAAFVRRHWSGFVEEDLRPPKDSKTALQEWALGRGLDLPVYRETGRTGPAHAPVFRIEVTVAGTATTGEGTSKRSAEQTAAARLLARLTATESGAGDDR